MRLLSIDELRARIMRFTVLSHDLVNKKKISKLQLNHLRLVIVVVVAVFIYFFHFEQVHVKHI